MIFEMKDLPYKSAIIFALSLSLSLSLSLGITLSERITCKVSELVSRYTETKRFPPCESRRDGDMLLSQPVNNIST
jgi:hypothetical protein